MYLINTKAERESPQIIDNAPFVAVGFVSFSELNAIQRQVVNGFLGRIFMHSEIQLTALDLRNERLFGVRDFDGISSRRDLAISMSPGTSKINILSILHNPIGKPMTVHSATIGFRPEKKRLLLESFVYAEQRRLLYPDSNRFGTSRSVEIGFRNIIGLGDHALVGTAPDPEPTDLSREDTIIRNFPLAFLHFREATAQKALDFAEMSDPFSTLGIGELAENFMYEGCTAQLLDHQNQRYGMPLLKRLGNFASDSVSIGTNDPANKRDENDIAEARDSIRELMTRRKTF